MTTLRDLVLERFGSISAAADELGVARQGLSSALSGQRTASVWYWYAVGAALGRSPAELAPYLLGNERRTGGGGTLAGSIRAKT
jgi:hypothetical protein